MINSIVENATWKFKMQKTIIGSRIVNAKFCSFSQKISAENWLVRDSILENVIVDSNAPKETIYQPNHALFTISNSTVVGSTFRILLYSNVSLQNSIFTSTNLEIGSSNLAEISGCVFTGKSSLSSGSVFSLVIYSSTFMDIMDSQKTASIVRVVAGLFFKIEKSIFTRIGVTPVSVRGVSRVQVEQCTFSQNDGGALQVDFQDVESMAEITRCASLKQAVLLTWRDTVVDAYSDNNALSYGNFIGYALRNFTFHSTLQFSSSRRITIEGVSTIPDIAMYPGEKLQNLSLIIQNFDGEFVKFLVAPLSIKYSSTFIKMDYLLTTTTSSSSNYNLQINNLSVRLLSPTTSQNVSITAFLVIDASYEIPFNIITLPCPERYHLESRYSVDGFICVEDSHVPFEIIIPVV